MATDHSENKAARDAGNVGNVLVQSARPNSPAAAAAAAAANAITESGKGGGGKKNKAGPGKGGASQPGGLNVTPMAPPVAPMSPPMATPTPTVPNGPPQVPSNPLAGFSGQGSPGLPVQPNPYFSMTGGINPGAAGNPTAQSDAAGVTYHGNPIATFMTTQAAKDLGLNTYDQAKAYVDAQNRPSGPVAPPPDQGGGGGGGGGGRRGGGAPNEAGGGTPADLGTQLSQLSRDHGGKIFKMDGALQGVLRQMGRGAQFQNILQQLGFQAIGQVNADGFINDWIYPTNLQMTPDLQAYLSTLDAADQMGLQMILANVLGVSGGGEAQTPPGVPTAQPTTPAPTAPPLAPGNPGPVQPIG